MGKAVITDKMSLISIEYKSYEINPTFGGKIFYRIVDSEFGEIEVDATNVGGSLLTRAASLIVKVYGERNLSVGKNLALSIIYERKRWVNYTVKDITEIQDRYCLEYIPNWKQYAKERDEHLEKLLALV